MNKKLIITALLTFVATTSIVAQDLIKTAMIQTESKAGFCTPCIGLN